MVAIGRHPDAVADVDRGIAEIVDADVGGTIRCDAFDGLDCLGDATDRGFGVGTVVDADHRFDDAIVVRVSEDFAEDVAIRDGDALFVFVEELNIAQIYAVHLAGEAVEREGVADFEGTGDDEHDARAVVGDGALDGEAEAEGAGT